MFRVIALSLMLGACAFAKPTVSSDYDRFANVTVVEVNNLTLNRDITGVPNLWLRPQYVCTGSRSCVPNRVRFLFISITDWYTGYASNHAIACLADGVRIQTSEVRYKIELLGAGSYGEIMHVETSLSEFEKLAKATQIECRLGTKVLTLTEEQVQSFRDLWDTIPGRDNARS